ncbi:uncharacterized protein LOC130501679 [Raphanus sativus]|uniref:Uncharacterized protein LOC130501679 n=1 Tax=Raphanus sativus TaxID=3726 RepID=A0A9W3CM16_RAPSA|nr:uncharacterized protein LOC130501679 [Raphanus sativus]
MFLVRERLRQKLSSQTLMEVKRLRWKFRGNDTIVVNRVSVEVLWDVHSWFFGVPSSPGNAVFMFRTCQAVEKTLSSTQVPTSLKPQSFGFTLFLYAWKNE